MKPVSMILLVAMAVACLLFILSTATNNWLHVLSIHTGLWKSCARDTCVDFPATEGALKAARAFMILAVLAECDMVLAAVLRLFKIVSQNLFIPIVVLGAAAAGCALLGLSIFAGRYKVDGTSFGWSYVVGWIGVVINVGVVVATAVADRAQE